MRVLLQYVRAVTLEDGILATVVAALRVSLTPALSLSRSAGEAEEAERPVR